MSGRAEDYRIRGRELEAKMIRERRIRCGCTARNGCATGGDAALELRQRGCGDNVAVALRQRRCGEVLRQRCAPR